MNKATCSLMMAILAAVGLATEQPGGGDDLWAPALPKNSKTHHATGTADWNAQAWLGATPVLRDNRPWRQPGEDLGRPVTWEGNPQESSFQDDNILGGDFSDAEKEAMLEVMQQRDSSMPSTFSTSPPWLAKRQTPRRLGWLVDLYRSVAKGLGPFVPQSETQVLSAAPERRSGRRPAACRFGPLALVCWNAARQVAVMRQRSSQYPQ